MLRSQQFRPNTSGHPAATAELGLVADDTKTGASFTWAESGMPNSPSLPPCTAVGPEVMVSRRTGSGLQGAALFPETSTWEKAALELARFSAPGSH